MPTPIARFLRTLRAPCTAGLFTAAACAGALADPGYYVQLPYAEPGVVAVDLRYWTTRRPGREAVLWPEAGLRWGVNSRWTTGLLASWIGLSLQTQTLSSLTWHNTWLLTQGEQPFDLALHGQLIHNTGADTTLALGPLLQTELGRTQLNLNLLFERDLAQDQGTQLKLQWQALHRLAPGLRLGLQGFGELGRWDRWAASPALRTGPVLRLRLVDRLEWQAAYLWGRVGTRQADMFSSQLTLGF